jgi:hypothetical protein
MSSGFAGSPVRAVRHVEVASPDSGQSPGPALAVAQRGLALAQVRQVRAQQREQVLERVDRLVKGMESLAQHISSDRVSTTQRSVMVSRFNDLQRRVNELDGIVGSEGRGDGVAPMRVSSGERVELSVENRERAATAFRQIRAMRQQIKTARQSTAEQRREVQQAIEQQLEALREISGNPGATAVQQARQAIQEQGEAVVGQVPSRPRVDVQA